ncbi:hypothetical protein [Clostridium estertheticum]|uniref:hypothetical protein n=1 Tax=Clostridium estertheticum TaxID=238834 RepID=UPI001C0AD178|nr:hypothetical protein [Clostridium estertheticum]MBU3186610.1 hypothetical protein [Clostridium estertheticum]
MLNKLEKSKILHLNESYRINKKIALEKGNIKLVEEYGIKLETMEHILRYFELTAWT